VNGGLALALSNDRAWFASMAMICRPIVLDIGNPGNKCLFELNRVNHASELGIPCRATAAAFEFDELPEPSELELANTAIACSVSATRTGANTDEEDSGNRIQLRVHARIRDTIETG